MSVVYTSSRRRHRPWYRKITRGQIGAVCTLVVALVVLLFFWEAYRANSALRLAANQAQVLQDQIVAGDNTSAARTLQDLQSSAHRAKTTTGGPLWDIGSKVPFVGKNVTAVQTVSDVIDNIATQALPPVVALSKQINLNTFSPHDGKVDLAAVRRIAPSVSTASAAMERAEVKLDRIDSDSLLVPLRSPVALIQAKVSGAQSAARSSDVAARLLPGMLGATSTRHYLLLIQNNAEVRSTGGISGSYAILKAKGGTLSMGFQGSIQDLKPFAKAVVPRTKEEKSIFPPTLVTDIRDANATPDFPRTGQITAAMAAKGLHQPVDGVISVDPVAMSYILGGTGPVILKKGVAIDQTNAVAQLLNTVYRLFPNPVAQDDVFKLVARKIFNVVKSGRGDPRMVVNGLVQSANQNRLLVWSSHANEEKLIRTTGVSGVFTGNDGATPHVGMYLGDAASTKMEYYLNYSTRVVAGRCLTGNVQELSTSTDISSSAPIDASKLPDSVTGDGTFTKRGTMRLIMRFFAPYHGGFTDVRVDGKSQTVYADPLYGRNATKVFITLKPGQTKTVMTAMISGKNQGNDAVFSTTPGVQNTANDVRVPSACK